MTSRLLIIALICLAMAGCGSGSGATHATQPPSVVDTCAASARSDAAAFSTCLANHGVLLNGGGLTQCAQSASSQDALIACMKRAAR